mgnify:CR=1 FL=1
MIIFKNLIFFVWRHETPSRSCLDKFCWSPCDERLQRAAAGLRGGARESSAPKIFASSASSAPPRVSVAALRRAARRKCHMQEHAYMHEQAEWGHLPPSPASTLRATATPRGCVTRERAQLKIAGRAGGKRDSPKLSQAALAS